MPQRGVPGSGPGAEAVTDAIPGDAGLDEGGSRPPPTSAAIAMRTAAVLLVVSLLIALLAPIGTGLAWLGASARTLHPLYRFVVRVAFALGGTTLEVHGRTRVPRDQAVVIVSNHESGWDPLCLLMALPELVIRFVVKEVVLRIPLLGRGLRATGNVFVARNDTASDIRRIEEEMQRRDPAVSMLFFAEGTRARDGALHPFKKGAFATALRHRLPVLPVAIAGTFRIWPKGTLRLRPGRVVVVIGEPIPIEGLGDEDRNALRDRSFGAVRELRSEARAQLRAAGVEPGGVD